jgi:hypothetical protein
VAAEVVVALSAAEMRAPSAVAIPLAAPATVAKVHLEAAAAALVVAVVVEVVAAAAAEERHVPVVVVAPQLHQGSRVGRRPGSCPSPRHQWPSDALRQAP